MGRRLNQLHSSNTKLQIPAGIKKPENSKQAFGMGGGISDGMHEFSRVNLSRLVKQMEEELENLEFDEVPPLIFTMKSGKTEPR